VVTGITRAVARRGEVLKAQIIASLTVIMCGHVLWWRRRDNILGYFQGGLFVVAVLIPVLFTTVIDAAEQDTVHLYARILVLGALGHVAGLFYGGSFGNRARSPRVTFSEPFDGVPRSLALRARVVAVVVLLALAGAYALLGYVPILAPNKLLAKYGVGPYQAGFQRGAQVLHLAMGMASAITGLILALSVVRRRWTEVALLVGLLAGLAATLSRGEAFIGPFTFLLAWAIQRRWRPWVLLACSFGFFLSSALVNELLFVPDPVASPTFAARVAQTAPDISDHLGFLHGFQLQGTDHVGTKTIQAGYSLSLSKGEWDPADYALRIRTGLSDVSELAAGGLRLPAPIWGYAAFGYAGVVAWSFVSGLFAGWGTALLRRLLAGVEKERFPNQSLNLMLALIFYNGTFGVLSQFYFPFRSDILVVGLALLFGVWPLRHRAAPPPEQERSLVDRLESSGKRPPAADV
jgi:hypothetical protein